MTALMEARIIAVPSPWNPQLDGLQGALCVVSGKGESGPMIQWINAAGRTTGKDAGPDHHATEGLNTKLVR